MNTLAIIQARMGSSRLPGKVLLPLAGKPMLWHIVNRLKQIPEITNIVVASSNQELDQQIVDFCIKHDINIFCGDENDVLDRFFQTAQKYMADEVIRITGDCPLIVANTISELIALFRSHKFDFCGVATGAGVAAENFTGRYPDGLDAEIMRIDVLAEAWEKAKKQYEREHVTPYIWQRPDRYQIGTLASRERDYSNYRWTVDNREDYELVCWIYEKLYHTNINFGLIEIIRLLKQNPEMMVKNQHFVGREGYEQFKA